MSEFQHTKTYPPMKRRRWPWIVAILAAAVFCFVGSCTAYIATTDGDPAATTTVTRPAPAPTTSGPAKAAPAKKAETKAAAPRATIGGDDVVHVGEDIPAGTYRAVEAVDGDLCYWKKSKDAEGANIIDNDIPTGGRPQVTLKKGQWFTSQGCPDWAAN